MPVRCQDCNSHFLLDGTTVVNGIGCPDCGGTQIERDQPSPTKSDGELRDMVDPATQLDQGGNPLQEGVWAGVDGGWQPYERRDEYFSKAAATPTPNLPVMSSHDPRFYTSMEPYLPWTHEAAKKEALLPALAPLALAGGRMLLGRALPGLMLKAMHGAGNFLDTGQHIDAPGTRPVGLVASEHIAVGINAPVETPHSTPDLVEDHDPESVDQQEFNDGDNSPAFNNPNNDNAEGGLSQSQGEDGMHQKLEFRHDGEGVNQAEMLLPLILEFIESPESGMSHPQLKALHDALEAEMPGYLDHADGNDEAVQEFLNELKKPKGVEARTAAPVYENTPVPQAQMQMGNEQMGIPLSNHSEFANQRFRELMAQGVDPKTAWQMATHEADQVHGRGAFAATKEALVPPIQPMQQQNGPMPGTHMNPVQMGGMPVNGKCMNCGGVVNADGSCPQCGASAGVNQQGNMEQQGQQQAPLGIMPSPYAKTAADHQGPITPQQKEVFAEYLIQQGRQDEVAAMMANPGIYADEWSQYLNRGTQPPEVDPSQTPPAPEMDPSQMGQMPMPGMQAPPPSPMMSSRRTADNVAPRCPKCESASTSVMGGGQCRCHRCQNIWEEGSMVKDSPTSSTKRSWVVKKSYPDNLNDAPNPVAAPAADVTAPGDREQQADSTMTWQSTDGTPLQVGQTYEMHNPGYAIPDIVKVQAVKPDSITVTMEGEYNSPSDPQDANGPGYTHEIDRNELQTEGLTFNPVASDEGEQEQSQDQAQQDGIGQTINTEPVERPHGDFPLHASVELPTDHCPKCSYEHVTSSYASPELVNYECYRCAHAWQIEDKDPGADLGVDLSWVMESNNQDDEIGFDARALAMASTGKSRNIGDIAQKDPRLQQIKERLNANKTAGKKFSPREQKDFIDEDGVARNADRLNLDGTHYESAFDNSKARPDRVNDNYLGLGL